MKIEHCEGKQRIYCFDDEVFEADAVIVTTPPKEACKMIKGAEGTSLQKWSEQSIPVTVAAVRYWFKTITESFASFCIGIRSTYIFTNQSRAN